MSKNRCHRKCYDCGQWLAPIKMGKDRYWHGPDELCHKCWHGIVARVINQQLQTAGLVRKIGRSQAGGEAR